MLFDPIPNEKLTALTCTAFTMLTCTAFQLFKNLNNIVFHVLLYHQKHLDIQAFYTEDKVGGVSCYFQELSFVYFLLIFGYQTASYCEEGGFWWKTNEK